MSQDTEFSYCKEAQRILRIAFASMQSDQSSQCTQQVAIAPKRLQADSKDSNLHTCIYRLIRVVAWRTCNIVRNPVHPSHICLKRISGVMEYYHIRVRLRYHRMLFGRNSKNRKASTCKNVPYYMCAKRKRDQLAHADLLSQFLFAI